MKQIKLKESRVIIETILECWTCVGLLFTLQCANISHLVFPKDNHLEKCLGRDMFAAKIRRQETLRLANHPAPARPLSLHPWSFCQPWSVTLAETAIHRKWM